MTTRSRSPQVSPISSEPEQILWKSKVATADSITMKKTNFTAQLAVARRFDDMFLNYLNVLPVQAVDDYVKDKLHNDGIDEVKPIAEIESSMCLVIVDRLRTTCFVWCMKYSSNMRKEH